MKYLLDGLSTSTKGPSSSHLGRDSSLLNGKVSGESVLPFSYQLSRRVSFSFAVKLGPKEQSLVVYGRTRRKAVALWYAAEPLPNFKRSSLDHGYVF